MNTPKENPVMHNGWHYEQSFSGKTVTINSGNLQELHKAVLQFRVQNKIEVGDVMADVNEWICKSYPKQCGPTSSKVVITNPSAGGNRVTKHIVSWAVDRLENDKKYTGSGEFYRRLEICENCPFNKPLPAECPTCVESLNRMLYILRRGMSDRMENTHICMFHMFDLQTGAWLTEPVPKKEAQPQQCWVK